MSDGKNKNLNCLPADVGGKKNKKGKIDRYSVKVAILEEKGTGRVNSILHVGEKNRDGYFFLGRHVSSS